jgi:Na+-transporting NADH:ubiquinone oxidoreductase subunit NqrB
MSRIDRETSPLSDAGEQAGGSRPRSARPHPRQAWGPPWLAPISHRSCLMLSLGVIFFGWRGMLGASATWLATLVTYLMVAMACQVFWPRRQNDSSLHVLTMGLLLGVSLPVMRDPMIPIIAGVALGLACHVIGRSHRLRIHPVAAVIVLVWVVPLLVSQQSSAPYAGRSMTTEPAVLKLDHVILGDLYDLPVMPAPMGAWWEDVTLHSHHAMRRPEPVRMLLGSDIPGEPGRLADLLSQSKLPRVEELLLGCVPGPVGATSKAIIIILGLYIIYRGLAWWPMAAGGMLAATLTLLLLPIRVDGHWTLLGMRIVEMGLSVGFVFVGYVLLASPLLWILMILAPVTAPMSSSGKILYGLIIGAAGMMAMYYSGLWPAAFLGLLLASALTRSLDALQRSPMLQGR